MKNLLAFEFRKLFRQKSFYICTSVMLALLFFNILLYKALTRVSFLDAEMPAIKDLLLEAVSCSNFTLLCGIFLSLFVCTDYSHQTIKNIYSRGFSRNRVCVAKYIVCIIATLIMFAVVLVFACLAGMAMGAKTGGSGNYVGLIAGQLVYCLAFSSFVFMLSIAIRKVGISITLAILAPSIVTLILSIADVFLKIDFTIGSYWFYGFINDLASLGTGSTRLIVCVALSVVYAAVFFVSGFFINRKRDV